MKQRNLKETTEYFRRPTTCRRPNKCHRLTKTAGTKFFSTPVIPQCSAVQLLLPPPIPKCCEIPHFSAKPDVMRLPGFVLNQFRVFLSELKVNFCGRRMKSVKRLAVHQAMDVSLPDELEILKFARRGLVLAEDDRYAASEEYADDVSHLRTLGCQAKIISFSRFDKFSAPDNALHSP